MQRTQNLSKWCRFVLSYGRFSAKAHPFLLESAEYVQFAHLALLQNTPVPGPV